MVGETVIKIALISDIHFGNGARSGEFALPNQELNGDAKNAFSISDSAVEIMKKEAVDYLFISGDLTSGGHPAEFYYCHQKIAEIVKKTGINEEHVIWCSGNHDNDWSISALASNSTQEKDLDVYAVSREAYDYLSSTMADSFFKMNYFKTDGGILPSSGIYEDSNIIVFVLNTSSNCVRKGQAEHGELTDGQLKWFSEQVSKRKNDGRWKMVLMHHHPFNYAFPTLSYDKSFLKEGDEFCDIAGKNGIDIVIHGHRHHPRCKTRMETNWGGPMSFICAGSFSAGVQQRDEGDIPNVFHILELSEQEKRLKLYSYEYYMGDGWQAVSQNRASLPMDKIMYLGYLPTESQTEQAIQELVEETFTTEMYEWDELDDAIKYRSSDTLKKIAQNIENSYSDGCRSVVIKITPLDNITIKKTGENSESKGQQII